MKNINIVALLVIICSISYSQKSVVYNYSTNQYLDKKDSILPLFGIKKQFSTTRKYYSPFIFSETRLFTGDDTKSILYKIVNGIWYYKQKHKWKLFYNYNNMIGGDISLFGIKHKIVPKGSVNIRNITLYKIFLEPVNLSQSHRLEYYFNPLKGVVIMQSDNGEFLFRSDSFKNPLTDDEIALL